MDHDEKDRARSIGECALCAEEALIPRFLDSLHRRGLTNRDAEATLLFLALVSRCSADPISIVVKGVASLGKSHLVDMVLSYFPKNAYLWRTSMSGKALVYSPESLKHRFLVFAEAAGASDLYFLQTLISEHRVSYEVTVQDEHGGFTTEVVEQEGPTGVIMTTTWNTLRLDMESRVISLELDDSRDAVMEILRNMADDSLAAEPDPDELNEWRVFLDWIQEEGEHRVFISFKNQLVEHIDVEVPGVEHRILRDFKKLIGLIEAHAVLHQNSRERDGDGRIIATLDDYSAVRDVFGPHLDAGLELSVPDSVRGVVGAVDKLSPDGEVSQVAIVRELGWPKDRVSRWVRKAIASGYLINHEPEGASKGYKLVIGAKLPSKEFTVLPAPESLEM